MSFSPPPPSSPSLATLELILAQAATSSHEVILLTKKLIEYRLNQQSCPCSNGQHQAESQETDSGASSIQDLFDKASPSSDHNNQESCDSQKDEEKVELQIRVEGLEKQYAALSEAFESLCCQNAMWDHLLDGLTIRFEKAHEDNQQQGDKSTVESFQNSNETVPTPQTSTSYNVSNINPSTFVESAAPSEQPPVSARLTNASASTSAVPYAPTLICDSLGPSVPYQFFRSISAMPHFSQWSVEECRLADYEKGYKRGPALNRVALPLLHPRGSNGVALPFPTSVPLVPEVALAGSAFEDHGKQGTCFYPRLIHSTSGGQPTYGEPAKSSGYKGYEQWPGPGKRALWEEEGGNSVSRHADSSMIGGNTFVAALPSETSDPGPTAKNGFFGFRNDNNLPSFLFGSSQPPIAPTPFSPPPAPDTSRSAMGNPAYRDQSINSGSDFTSTPVIVEWEKHHACTCKKSFHWTTKEAQVDGNGVQKPFVPAQRPANEDDLYCPAEQVATYFFKAPINRKCEKAAQGTRTYGKLFESEDVPSLNRMSTPPSDPSPGPFTRQVGQEPKFGSPTSLSLSPNILLTPPKVASSPFGAYATKSSPLVNVVAQTHCSASAPVTSESGTGLSHEDTTTQASKPDASHAGERAAAHFGDTNETSPPATNATQPGDLPYDPILFNCGA